MIGRTTVLWLVLAMLVGIGLFHVKYQVMTLEEELNRLNAATLREQNQIHVLEAEWSYLNRPSQLEELAERYLGLKAISPQQLSTVAALPRRPAIETDMSDDPNRIAKMVPPRKPPMPTASTRAPNAPARIIPPTNAAPTVNAAATARYPSQPTSQPLPAPVTPVGLAAEGRPLKDRP
jgi:cell division protein FtsL